ncbi:MAG: redoxin family protein [Candidatus Acidiferrales bacterium]
MLGEFRAILSKFRFCWALLLTAAFPLAAGAQTAPGASLPGERTADALTFLKEVCHRYEHVASYHIESVEEWQTNGDFSRNWSKSLTTAIVASGNRYRFERRFSSVWWLQVSDGKNEWIYQPSSQQYTQQPAPDSGPSRFKSPYYTFQELNEAQDIPKNLSRWSISIRSAAYLPDEIIELNGKLMNCYLIEAQAKSQQTDITLRLTFWIDKDTHFVRKVREQEEGPIILNEPYEHYVSDRIILYPVADLDASSAPDSFFTFNPPSTAKLVKEFDDPTRRSRRHIANDIVGKAAPPINLHSADGRTVSLKSFQGKPVLLDFWATWCGPCLDSIPFLEKLYRETSNKGLVMLSIDEDEDAKEASDYFTEHKEPWPNFHGSDDITAALPHLGIPYFVLVDASGKIAFTSSDFDELRAAVAKLGPEFASLANTTKP